MKLSLCITSLLLSLFMNFHATGQSNTQKYGKIDMADMKTEVCPIDSNANAFFIFDKGQTEFIYLDTRVISTDAGN
ncbi:MAG: hypothetical protein HC830_12960, partial [Bacteroidetes bacterium]|nr:hypothetical protein [Bacteroidota bacterium]